MITHPCSSHNNIYTPFSYQHRKSIALIRDDPFIDTHSSQNISINTIVRDLNVCPMPNFTDFLHQYENERFVDLELEIESLILYELLNIVNHININCNAANKLNINEIIHFFIECNIDSTYFQHGMRVQFIRLLKDHCNIKAKTGQQIWNHLQMSINNKTNVQNYDDHPIDVSLQHMIFQQHSNLYGSLQKEHEENIRLRIQINELIRFYQYNWTNKCMSDDILSSKTCAMELDKEMRLQSLISISPSTITPSSSIATIDDTMYDSDIDEDICNSSHIVFEGYLSSEYESEIDDDIDTCCDIKECIHLKNVFDAIKSYISLNDECYIDINIGTIWDSYYHLIYVHDSNEDDVEYIGQLFHKYHEGKHVEQLQKIEMSHNLIEQTMYTIYRCCMNVHSIGRKATMVTCPNNGSNPSSQPTNNSNGENKRNDNDRQQQEDNNNNNNNNSNSGSNTSGTGGDGNKDRDGDDNKKRSNDSYNNEEDEEDEEEEKNKEEKEQQTKLKEDIKLNVNAPQFYPNNTMPTLSTKKGSKAILDTIDEDGKEEKELKNISPKKLQTSKLDSMPIKCAGTIEISRHLTQKIIPERIKENIFNIYHFMDKSTALRNNKKKLKNETFVIMNYDFHDKDTEEMLYCIVRRQDPVKHRGFSWIMMDRLFTKNEILIEFNISEKDLILPTSPRQEFEIIQQMNYMQSIHDILQIQFPRDMIQRTQWHRIPIYNKRNNKKRKVLYLTKKEFIKRVEYFSKNTKDINIIPIMVLNSNKEYWIEHIYIIKIDENDHIGISMKYKPKGSRIEVTGIHLNKQYILNKHQLAAPYHDSMCLDYFVSDIDDLKIGNIDADKNRIKDLQKRHDTLKREKDRDKNMIAIYQQKYKKFKQFVTRFINPKIPTEQLRMEAKEALDSDNDERSSPIIAPESSNTNSNTIDMNITNPSNSTISLLSLGTPPYALSTTFPTFSTIGASMYTSILPQNHGVMSLPNLASTGHPIPSGNINTMHILPIPYHPDDAQIVVTNKGQSTKSNPESHI